MPRKHKPLTQFERGYICAVSTLIGGHGCNTDAYDTFKALGVKLDRIEADRNLPEYDRQNLQQLKTWPGVE